MSHALRSFFVCAAGIPAKLHFLDRLERYTVPGRMFRRNVGSSETRRMIGRVENACPGIDLQSGRQLPIFIDVYL
jgi:hypothetical protein